MVGFDAVWKGRRELEVGLADEKGRVTLQASRVAGLRGQGRATGDRGQEFGHGCVAAVTRCASPEGGQE